MLAFIRGFNLLIFALFTLLYVYQMVYVVVALWHDRRKHPTPPARRNHKYAAVISARNERAVIGELVHSIKKQEYPTELLDVFVVADNCTDDTAAVARAAGAIVFERFDRKQVGKTGDGILMAMQLGAGMVQTGHCHMMHDFDSGPMASVPFMAVNMDGNRFMNEATSLLTSAHIIADLPGHGNYVWHIIPTNDFAMPSSFGYDKETAAKVFDIETNEHYEADTIEELAEMIGVDPEVLSATVSRYNELCEAGEDTDYMKAARYLDPIDDGPYQAWKMNYYFYCTLGGVRCNENLQVLDADWNPIPGLYAGGNTVGYRFGASYETLLHGGSNGLAATHAYVAGEQAALA